MSLLPSIVAYAALGVFALAAVARVVFWLRLPIHVRWELYPVAHDAKRAAYGGSYLEEQEWWKKPRESSIVGELRVMVPEILFLAALREHNFKLWLRSFPFHFGIYLVIGATVLMMAVGLVSTVAPTVVLGGLAVLAHYAVVVTADLGLALGTVGALGMLHRRLTDPDLKDFTAPADIFNLVFFVVTFGVAFAHVALFDRDLTRSMAFVQGLVSLSPAALAGSGAEVMLGYGAIVLLALLMAYIPLTHMSHFIGKYFAYHAVRWNDTPNLKGGPQEAAIARVLSYPVSWSAPHIKGDGKKTWADVATEQVKK